MHVNLNKDPIEIRWRSSVLSVVRIFHCEYSLHAKGILPLTIAQLLLQVLWVWWGQFTHVASLDPKKNYTKKYGLGGLEEDIYLSIQSMSFSVWLQREQDSFWANSFCNLDDISTCMIIQSWGFMLRLSPGYIFCVMCDWFLLISYICSIALSQFD